MSISMAMERNPGLDTSTMACEEVYESMSMTSLMSMYMACEEVYESE